MKKQNSKWTAFKPFVGTLSVAAIAGIVACTVSGAAKARPNIVHKDATKPGVVAKINGEEITEDALVGDEKLDFYEIKKQEYDFKMKRVNDLLVDKLVGAEAKKANMSKDDYIEKKVLGGKVKVSDKDYKKFVEERHIPEAQIQQNPQIKERIMSYLEGLKKQDQLAEYVAKLTKSNPVEVYFKRPKSVEIEMGNAPTFGGKDAKVKIVEFSDFQCPYCGRAASTVTEIKKKYGNKIQLAFRHFPLSGHPQARPAAEASMCVNEQGVDKFWKLHDLLFKNQDKLAPADLENWAKQAGADVKKYKECVDAKKYVDAVQKDFEYGEKVGIKSTPTFFINGNLVSGAQPLEAFSEIIDEELAQ